jgi:TetR/AcrR family transcriptional repressor of nem operon
LASRWLIWRPCIRTQGASSLRPGLAGHLDCTHNLLDFDCECNQDYVERFLGERKVFVSKETTGLNRGALLGAASRLFREKGIDGVGVAEIAKEAGLTHGALYKHFPSKEALAAEAFYHPIATKNAETDVSDEGRDRSFEEYLDAMFSIEHRDNLANGCPMTASASEIARQGPAVAASFTRAFKERVTDLEASIKRRMPASQRRQFAVSALAAQIGAIAVARAVAKVDASLSKEVLQAVRETLKSTRTVTGKVKRSRTVRSTR